MLACGANKIQHLVGEIDQIMQLNTINKSTSILGMLTTINTTTLCFFVIGLPGVFRLEGFDLATIGFMQAIGLPYLLKFLWAPLVDRANCRNNHYKKWVFVTALLAGLLFFFLGLLDLRSNFPLVACTICCLAVISSTCDIAVSALYIKLLTFEQRGAGSSVKVLAFNLAILLGGGALFYIYNHWGWRLMCLAMTSGYVLVLLNLAFLTEGIGQRGAQGNRINWMDAISFFRRPGMTKWLIIMIIHSLGISAGYLTCKPFMVDRNLPPDTIAFLVGLYGSVLGVASSFFFAASRWLQGFLLDRTKFLIVLTLANIPVTGLFILASESSQLFWPMLITLGCVNLSITFSSLIFNTMAMDLSRPGKEGLDYSVQMTAIHLGGMGMATISGVLVENTGYELFYVLQTILSLLVAVAIWELLKGGWFNNLYKSVKT
jgi:MFS transporter, PAT family, beta-lactamase induction signal transducer AmpG